jgi:hypothetical protein
LYVPHCTNAMRRWALLVRVDTQTRPIDLARHMHKDCASTCHKGVAGAVFSGKGVRLAVPQALPAAAVEAPFFFSFPGSESWSYARV